MRSFLLRGIAVCAAVPLLVTLLGPAASAEEPAEPDAGATMVDRIVAAAEDGARTPATLAEEVSLPETGGGSLTFDSAQRITATVMFDPAQQEAALAAVAELAEVAEVSRRFPAATVRVDPAQLGALAEILGVASAEPALRPLTSGGGTRALESALPEAVAEAAGAAAAAGAAGTPDRCGPIPHEADAPLRADAARDRFGVDGTGVTIGIISDSFAATALPTSWEDDVASGALPGPGNPCGYTTPVELMSDEVGGTDEGRGMAQLVHSIAPGAELMFADQGWSDVVMADHIVDLANAGAEIIVDDITWTNETTFQLGLISQAIESVKAVGVAYFTAAGNATGVGSRGESAGLPITSWNTTAYRPTECPAWLLTGDDDPLAEVPDLDCLDFDPDPATAAAYDTWQLRESSDGSDLRMHLVGSIGEPRYGVTTRYEWRVYRVDGATQDPELVGVASQFGAQHPGSNGVVNAPSGSELRTVMVRTQHDPAAPAPAVQFMAMRGGEAIAERTFLGDGVSDFVGPTTFGHAGDGTAVSVASVDWADPATVRSYSSIGPATLRFAPMTDTPGVPAEPLPAPVQPATPHIAAVDGTRTTFFGDSNGDPEDPEYRFFGTSAASPYTAAVAALAKSYRPELGGAELTERLLGSARDAADGGPVNPYASLGIPDAHVFGAGLVDAEALLAGLTDAPATPQGLAASEETQTSFLLEWDAVPGAATLELEVELIVRIVADAASGAGTAGDAAAAGSAAAGSAPAGAQPVVSTSLDGTATSHRVDGLASGGVYAVRLAARNPVGVSDPALLEVSTQFDPGPIPPTPTPPTPTPPGPTGPPAAKTPLAQTGGASAGSALLGAGAILLLGAGVATVGAVRRRVAAE